MDFSATRVSTEDFAGEQIRSILFEANKQIEGEKRLIAQGYKIKKLYFPNLNKVKFEANIDKTRSLSISNFLVL